MANSPQIYHFAIAFVGPLGSGCTTSYNLMKEVIAEEELHKGSYEVISIKVSDILKEMDSSKTEFDRGDNYKKTRHLQDIGNELRRVDPFRVGELITKQLIKKRTNINFSNSTSDVFVFSIIDSLKNPYDLSFLKKVYGRSLMLIGITADKEIRWKRLKRKPGWRNREDLFKEVDDIDREEVDEQGNKKPFGQNVEKVFLSADYFIVNNEDSGHNLTYLKKELGRAVQILSRNQFITPAKHETFMHFAWSASRRSLCMSRQVGAAIVSKTGSLLSIGWNDVPKAGGGLYSEASEGQTEGRCAKYGSDFICYNDKHKAILINELVDIINEECEVNKEELKKILRRTKLSDLIEFSRAVHAEMEALISIGRNATSGLQDSIMYVTTMPCHSCARHIVAAGIQEVQFIEPYRKSKAVELHGDSINLSNKRVNGSVWFRQYGGIAPSNYLETFEAHHERKFKDTGRKALEFHETYLDEKYQLKNFDKIWYTSGKLVNLIAKERKGENETGGTKADNGSTS